MSDTDLRIEPVDEIPPVKRTSGEGGKYDYLFEAAANSKTRSIKVIPGSREKANSLATYLRRIADDEEFNVTQRLDEVYIEHLA